MSWRDTKQRLIDVIKGRGADGSLGSLAQARACTPDRFRPTETPDPSTLDGSAYDRAFALDIVDIRDAPQRNVHCNEVQLVATLEVRIAYASGIAVWETVHGEFDATAQQEAAADWKTRATLDAREIARALTWYELTGNDTVPVIESVHDPVVALTETAQGRGLLLLRFALRLEDTQP